MTAASTTPSLSGLPIGFEAEGSDALLELFRKERDPDLWHLCLTQMNPDTGVVYPLAIWVIEQPEVDRATAMLLLEVFGWNTERNGGKVYPVYSGSGQYRYAPDSDGPDRERDAFNLAIDRLRRGDFSRAELSARKYSIVNETDARDFEPKILLSGQPGHKPNTPWKVFDETAVVYDPHDTVITPYWM